MNELQIFKNSEFGELGVISIEGKEYFPASECAKILGYSKPYNAIKQHCRYTLKQGVPHPQNPNKTMEVNFIPEGDLYRLITHSKLPTAERFEHWIFDEVLPTIRKTGGYVANDTQFVETYLPFADDNTKALFSQTLQTIRTQNEKLKQQEPLVQFAETVQGTDTNILVRETAKLAQNHTGVDIGERKLYRKLREWGFVCGKKNEPTQRACNLGILTLVKTEYHQNGEPRISQTTKVTPKGQVYIVSRLVKETLEGRQSQ